MHGVHMEGYKKTPVLEIPAARNDQHDGEILEPQRVGDRTAKLLVMWAGRRRNLNKSSWNNMKSQSVVFGIP